MELLLYLCPTIVAVLRKHNATRGVFAVNLFLGWTIIGWLVALVWSMSSNKRSTQPDL